MMRQNEKGTRGRRKMGNGSKKLGLPETPFYIWRLLGHIDYLYLLYLLARTSNRLCGRYTIIVIMLQWYVCFLNDLELFKVLWRKTSIFYNKNIPSLIIPVIKTWLYVVLLLFCLMILLNLSSCTKIDTEYMAKILDDVIRLWKGIVILTSWYFGFK